MLCKSCGNEIAKGSKFCAACGAHVEDVSKASEPTTTCKVDVDPDREAIGSSARLILTQGICSVAFACTFWLGIVGWVMGAICKKTVREHESRFGPVSGVAKVGTYLGIGGYVGGIVTAILSTSFVLGYIAFIIFYAILIGLSL